MSAIDLPSQPDLTEAEDERDAVSHATALSPRLMFETIHRHGQAELHRPLPALWFSGIAAGVLIGFSILGEALFRANLPDVDWRPMVENLGYTLGFVLVILGRMQLFTENTITTVVPIMLKPKRETLQRTAQLWATVLLANVLGAFLFASFLNFTPVLAKDVSVAMVDLSRHATGFSPQEGFFRGIPAGVLIAALVWMMPSAQSNALALIVVFTWLIAMGDFTHIVAGSVEMAFLIVRNDLTAPDALLGFFLPVLAGNIVGGTFVFTLLTWAQIKPEVQTE